jgi:hypothetical protein
MRCRPASRTNRAVAEKEPRAGILKFFVLLTMEVDKAKWRSRT